MAWIEHKEIGRVTRGIPRKFFGSAIVPVTDSIWTKDVVMLLHAGDAVLKGRLDAATGSIVGPTMTLPRGGTGTHAKIRD